MAVIYNGSVKAARSTVVRDAIDAAGSAGYLEVWTLGYLTLLAKIQLGYPGTATATINEDLITLAGFPRSDLYVDVSGVAASARITDGNGAVCVSGMTVGTSNADIVLFEVNLVQGQRLTILTAKLGNVDYIVAPPPPPPPEAPYLTTMVPTSGSAGATVTLTGTLFGTARGTVLFGDSLATISTWSDTQIVCTAPSVLGGVGVVVTSSTGGVGNSLTFTGVAAPPPPPPPPPVEARALGSYAVWPNYITKLGADAVDFNNAVKLRWKNRNGDWLDANQQAQGTTPWYTLSVPKASTGYFELPITTLAQRWQAGENRGAYFLCDNSSNSAAWVTWSGTYGPNPPQLVITRSGFANTTIRGDLCGFTVASLTANTPPSGLDTGLSARMSRQTRQIVHFPGVDELAGTITSATLRLHANATDDIYPLNIKVFETDAPPLLLGGAGLPPTYGLAMEVGEANLPGHDDVLRAGDFREANWNATPGVWTDQSLGRGLLFDYTGMNRPQYQKTQVVPDPDHPGRFYLRTCIATGQIGGGEFVNGWHESGPPETGRMPDPAGYEPEIYHRCEIWLEQDSFWSNNYAFKFSPVGMNLRYGKGEDDGEWNGNSIWIFGSGQTSSDGKRHWNEEYQQWILKGHSIRGHLLGQPHPTHTAYPGAVALGIAPSHIGPFDTFNDGAVYGTEQNLRIGTKGQDHCIPMNRWVTIESRCRVNTVDMSVLDADGNGVARNDGIWEMWLDGVLVGGRYNLAWFCHPSMGVRGTWTMAYHGGNTATDHDIWWRIRNHCVARRYIGPARLLT